MKVLGHVVSEKKIFFLFFFPIVSPWELLTPRGGAIFCPLGYDSQDLCKVLNNNAAYQI